jgi:hypothetical protein
MFQYVVRRLLYSVVVLFAASFLVFTFVAVSGDPLAPLRITPNVSQQTIDNLVEKKHLGDPIPVRYAYWLQDAATNQFGTTLIGERPILPDLWRVMKHTLDRERGRVLPFHARFHARGRELGLRAHRPREGPLRAEGDDEARLP